LGQQIGYIDELLDKTRLMFTELYLGTTRDLDAIIPSKLDTKLLDERFNRLRERLQEADILAHGKHTLQPQRSSTKSVSPATSPETAKKKKSAAGKKPRVWENQAATGDAAKALDFSTDSNYEADADAIQAQWVDKNALGTRNKDGLYEAADLQTIDDELDSLDQRLQQLNFQEKPSKLSSFFSSLTGKRGPLTQEDLAPALQHMKEHLILKNVASNVAASIVESVGKGLIGRQLASYGNVKKAVRGEIESALTRVLTPRNSTDVLRDILHVRKKEARPYVIVFCGVNGVGKSTNLAKICFWLLQNGLRVLIAGCDTFRSGAVEQLKVHARNLNALVGLGGNLVAGEKTGKVELYERGYGKDAAGIAKEAIAFAKQSDYDVVLVDTAGRMQDNEPLMRALAKLITTNSPDKVIFVGEALVGNEAVDQLVKFNQALKDFSGVVTPRQIDGMVLTKFDTIDDKVGAAISMTYITGQPVLFVGTGQTYTDLKKMNVGAVVGSLLKE